MKGALKHICYVTKPPGLLVLFCKSLIAYSMVLHI